MGTSSIYRHPQYHREGGEVILKENPLRVFYAIRFAMSHLMATAIMDDATFESLMWLAGMSGQAYMRTVERWTKESYDDLMAGADRCAEKGMKFADFEERLLGDYGFTIAVEVEDDEDDDE